MTRPPLEGESDLYIGRGGPEFMRSLRRARVQAWACFSFSEEVHQEMRSKARGEPVEDGPWSALANPQRDRLLLGGGLKRPTFERLNQANPDAQAFYDSPLWEALNPANDLRACQRKAHATFERVDPRGLLADICGTEEERARTGQEEIATLLDARRWLTLSRHTDGLRTLQAAASLAFAIRLAPWLGLENQHFHLVRALLFTLLAASLDQGRAPGCGAIWSLVRSSRCFPCSSDKWRLVPQNKHFARLYTAVFRRLVWLNQVAGRVGINRYVSHLPYSVALTSFAPHFWLMITPGEEAFEELRNMLRTTELKAPSLAATRFPPMFARV